MLKQLRLYFSRSTDQTQPNNNQPDHIHHQTSELTVEANSHDSDNGYQSGNEKSGNEVLSIQPTAFETIPTETQPIITNGNGNITTEENSTIEQTGIQPLAGDELQRVTARKQFELGHYYREQGQFDAAVMQYRKTLILDPGLAEAYHSLAEALRESGNLAEAATYYRQAIALTEQQSSNGHSSNGHGSNGHSSNGHSSNGHSHAAEQEQALQAQPLSEVQLTTVGQVEGASGTSAVEVVLEAKESDLAQAEQYYAQQQWQETVTHCQAAVQICPSAVAYKLMGNALQRLEQFEAAMDAYLEAIKLEPRSAEIHANLGSMYAQQQRWHDAVMYYQSAITLKPDFAGAYRNLARVWTQLDRSDNAMECWIEATKLEPQKVPVDQLVNVGDLLLEQNQIDEAISCYRQAIKSDPEHIAAYQQLAEVYTQQQRWQEAVECYRQVQALSQPATSMLMLQGSRVPSLLAKSGIENLPLVQGGQQDMDNLLGMLRQGWNPSTRFGEVEEQLEEAEDYFEQEQWDEAIAASSAALEQLEPEMVQAYRNLAQALYAKNDLDEAIRYYRRVVELEPEAAADWVNLGSLYAQLQQWQGAIQCYQTALKLNPQLASAHWNLAKVWQRTNQPEQASDSMLLALSIEPDWASKQEHLQLCHTLLSQGKTEAAAICYRQVIQLDSGCAEAHVRLADLFMQAGQWQEAIAHYQQAVQHEPKNAQYYARLGFALAQVQQIDGAIEAYRRVVALAPDQPEYFRTLAGWLEQQQVWDELIVCLQKLGALQPQDAELHHKLGDLLNQRQRWQEAVPAFQRAIELNPDFSWSHNNLGDALIHLERWQEAAEAYKKAIELNPEFHWSHYNLGEALAKLEDWDGAIGGYEKALELEPDHDWLNHRIGGMQFIQGMQYLKAHDVIAAMQQFQKIDRAINLETAKLPWFNPTCILWSQEWTSWISAMERLKPIDRPWPRITVVTPSLNQANYIAETILSVINQQYPNLEYIVVDGGSTDGTLAILSHYRPYLTNLIVEPDRGQSDAINKGFQQATGDLLIWLNSDDRLVQGALHMAALTYLQNPCDVIAGMCLVHQNGQLLMISKPRARQADFTVESLADISGRWASGYFFYQPEVFFSRSIWERSGGRLNENLHYAMDHDLWLRLAQVGAKLEVVDYPFALFRKHDHQKTANQAASTGELLQVARGYSSPQLSQQRTQEIVDKISTFLNSANRRILVIGCTSDFPHLPSEGLVVETLGRGYHFTFTNDEYTDKNNFGDFDAVFLLVGLTFNQAIVKQVSNSGFSGLTVAWLWHNHLAYDSQSGIAKQVDVTVPAQGFVADVLRNSNSILAKVVPPCTTQWAVPSDYEGLQQWENHQRSNELYGRFVYDAWAHRRNQLIEAIERLLPQNHLRRITEADCGLSLAEQFRQGINHKVALCLPIQGEFPASIFDALLYGQIPIVPAEILNFDQVISRELQETLPIIVFHEYSAEAVIRAYQVALLRFDADGWEGVQRRHEFVLKHHLLQQRFDDVLKQLVRLSLDQFLQTRFGK